MNIKLKRLLLPLLRAVKEGRPITFRMRSAARQSLFLIEKPVSLKSKAAKAIRKKAAASSRASHNQETAAIRKEVFDRAGGRCEYHYGYKWGLRCEATAAELDHWLSGIGRRRQKQAVENCWALCPFHHGQRTRNYPTAPYWNAAFAAHAAKYGYPPLPHVEHADLPERAAT